MKNSKILVLLFFFVLSISCDKDDSPSNNNDPAQNTNVFAEFFGSEISRDFLGTVVDKNQNPIENAMVSIGSLNAFTDTNGVFIIRNATVNERFGYVKVEKSGFLHGSRAVVPTSGTNKVTIMLLEETIAGTTNSGTSETISLTNGASVALEGDYINEDGSSYSGSVDVIMHHLDPVDENMQVQMPGMLYAANAQNEERMLQTFGMLAVELKGSSGEKLNLAEGSSAEITVPLDATLLADAPTTIPLWHFDEEKGYWIEDGEATLVGNAYVGTVSHFSFWNCDVPNDFVNLCVTVTDVNGNPILGLTLGITSNTYGSTYSTTNENGEVCGFVPNDETLEINIYNYEICNLSTLHTASIGPFSENSSLDILILNPSEYSSEKVIGKFNTCSGEPINSGYVVLKYNNLSNIYDVSNGTFEIDLFRCASNNSFSISAYDFTNNEISGEIEFTFANEITNLGNIRSCNEIEEFVQYNLDGIDIFSTDNINSEFYLESTYFDYPVLNIWASIGLECNFAIIGNLNDSTLVGNYNYSPDIFNDIGFYFSGSYDEECTGFVSAYSINNNVTFQLNKLGEVGDYIDISFSGDYLDYQGTLHTISGLIHVIRDL